AHVAEKGVVEVNHGRTGERQGPTCSNLASAGSQPVPIASGKQVHMQGAIQAQSEEVPPRPRWPCRLKTYSAVQYPSAWKPVQNRCSERHDMRCSSAGTPPRPHPGRHDPDTSAHLSPK